MKFALLLSAFFALPASAGVFKFDFSNKNAILIGSTTSSCSQVMESANVGRAPFHDIASKYFSLVNPRFDFAGSPGERLWIASIRIRMADPALQGGSYQCEVAGDELGWLFGNGTVPWNGMLTPSRASVTANQSCVSLKCGNVDVSPNMSFKTTATINVEGYMTDPNGDESPITGTWSINVENRQ